MNEINPKAKTSQILLTIVVVLAASVAYAGEADVLDVSVKQTAENAFSFSVTVRHQDEGWDHYANKWDVVAPDGTVLGTRTLHHPHENEQPFTRSLSGVQIPQNIHKVTIRAHDSVHQYGGKTVTVKVPK
jgi:hypothetical protein